MTRISVHFDATSNKHRVDVEFSAQLSRLLADEGGADNRSDPPGEPHSNQAQELSDRSEDSEGDCVGKKPRGSWESSAAEINYSVTVE